MQTLNVWISSSDWTNTKNLPSTLDYDEEIKPRAQEAQEMDLYPVFGLDFYTELVQTLDNSNIVTTETYTQAAYTALLPYIKDIVKHFAYSRYLDDAGIVLTRSGPVIKNTPQSEPISDKTRAKLIHIERSKGIHYIDRMREFFDETTHVYDNWGDSVDSTKKADIRIQGV